MSGPADVPDIQRLGSRGMRPAVDSSSEPLESVASPAHTGGKRVVRGITIPPLDLTASPSRRSDRGDESNHEQSQAQPQQRHTPQHQATIARRPHTVPVPASSTPVGTPTASAAASEHAAALVGDAAAGAGDGNGRQQQSYGAWYMPPKEWKAVYGVRRSSGGVEAPAGPSGTASPPPSIYLPEGVEGVTEEDRANREAMALELGLSYSARAYKEHLRAHHLRPPTVLERMPTPSEEQIRKHQMEAVRLAHTRREQAGHSHGEVRSSSGTVPPSPGAGSGGPPAGAGAFLASALSSRRYTPRGAGGDGGGLSTPQLTLELPDLQQLLLPPPAFVHNETMHWDRPLLSSRSMASDGRQGTGGSSAGAEADADAAPPTPVAAATAAKAAAAAAQRDGIETLDDVMAPALRERVRQMLAAQDAMIAHQERMREYEQERELAKRARQAAADAAVAPAGGGVSGGPGKSPRKSLISHASRNSGRAGRISRPSIGGRQSITSISPASPGRLPAAAGGKAGGGKAVKTKPEKPKAAFLVGLPKTSISGRSPFDFLPSRSLKRVSLLLGKRDKDDDDANASNSGIGSAANDSCNGGAGSSSSSDDDGGGSSSGEEEAGNDASGSAEAPSGQESGQDSTPTPSADKSQQPQQRDSDPQQQPQQQEPPPLAQEASANTIRSANGGSSRPGRSSSRTVPLEQRMTLPGAQGDLNHLLLLLEKLPSRKRSGRRSTVCRTSRVAVGEPARATSPIQRRSRLSVHQLTLQHSPRSVSPSACLAAGGGGGWGEAVVQAALGGLPVGAAASLLSRGGGGGGTDDRTSFSNKASLTSLSVTPSVSVFLTAAEASGLLSLAAAAAAAAGGDGGTLGRASTVTADDSNSIPLAVQLMMGFVPTSEGPLASLRPVGSVGSPPDKSGLVAGSASGQLAPVRHALDGNHHHHHHHHHHYSHEHQHQHQQKQQQQQQQGVHEIHEQPQASQRSLPPQEQQQLRESGLQDLQEHIGSHNHHHLDHQHHHRHHHHHHHHERDTGDIYRNQQQASDQPSQSLGESKSQVLQMSSSLELEDGVGIGGGGGGSGGKLFEGGGHAPDDAAWRAWRHRYKLPPERLSGAGLVPRDGPGGGHGSGAAGGGGGCHSFAPEQVAALANGRISGTLAAGPGAAASASSSSVVMPPLRIPPPPVALSATASTPRSGGASGPMLPELGARAQRGGGEYGAGAGNASKLAFPGSAGGAVSPAMDLYALGLLPNPSLLRASMAMANRSEAPKRRRPAAAGLAASAAGGDLLGFSPSPSPYAAAFSALRPDPSVFGAAAGAVRRGGPYSAPVSPVPSQYVHTHPHVPPGSTMKQAEAAEAAAMHERSRRGRPSPLSLQHMLGVDVPLLLLQAR